MKREAGVGVWKEEMGIRAPESIVELGEYFRSCGWREEVLARTRHGLESKAETGKRIRLAVAWIGMHAEESGREEGRQAAHGGTRWPTRWRQRAGLRERRRIELEVTLGNRLRHSWPLSSPGPSTHRTLTLLSPAMSSRTSFQNSASRPSSSSAVPSLAAVADPALRHVDGAAMDYFVIEMVNTLRASSAVAAARAKKTEQEMVDAGLMPASAPVPPPLKKSQLRESIASNASRTSLSKDAKDEDEEELRARLEAIGMHVGANMAERCVLSSLVRILVFTGPFKLVPRPRPLLRHSRCGQVYLQRSLERMLGETGR